MRESSRIGGLLLAALLSSLPLRVQAGEETSVAREPTDAAELETLRREIRELRDLVLSLQKQLAQTLPAQTQAPAPPSPATDLAGELARELGTTQPQPPPSTPQVAEPAAPAPITVATGAGGRNYLNLSLDGLFVGGTSSTPDIDRLETGAHDPTQRGFTIQNVETVLEGAVDPYFRGQANIVLQIGPEGETEVELEEVYATTSALSNNLQVKAGQFFTEFGRINHQHPHTWDFVDQPLVNGRLFGGDGLRNPGARLSWLVPTPFYSELFITALNSQGETVTSFRGVPGDTLFGRTLVKTEVSALGDMIYMPRYSASFDLTGNQTLLTGASVALGPNGTGEDGRTHIYGLDAYWKWKSPHADKGFPFVKVQSEWMTRAYRAAATATQPEETFRDWGTYAQAVWGFRPRWLVGGRYDRVAGDRGDPPGDPELDSRWRASANLTWFPTEYSKLRLQYNHDAFTSWREEDSLWLQLEFLLGAHAAHKF